MSALLYRGEDYRIRQYRLAGSFLFPQSGENLVLDNRMPVSGANTFSSTAVFHGMPDSSAREFAKQNTSTFKYKLSEKLSV